MQIGSSTSAYSSASVSQMHSKLFSRIDADEDGSLSLEELQASSPGKKSGQTDSATSVAERFAVMDSDGDGSVTEDEGLAFFTSSMSSDTMSGMLQAQEAGQQDGSRPSGPPPTGGGGGQAPQTFDELDTNQDGTVSLDEMLASSESESSADTSMIEELFSHMDADGDGSVTEDEKTAFDETMKANGPPKGPPPAMMSETTSAVASESTVSEETAAKIASLTAQWMTSVYQALSEGTKQTSTTSVAA
ncbi:MAG: hypothetical protein B7Z26_07985 [Asticcacaulis sp. 32-58-5]|nr:MAG: hypothetical protein B7Z26_07985 [Asticcacaulis sp. 32-58-5]